MDEESERQEWTERGAEGPLPSTDQPTSTQLELHRIPTEVLLGGDGYLTWASSVKKMFFNFNKEPSKEALESELTDHIQRDDTFYCSEIKHGYRLVVVQCPKAVQRKEEIGQWLQWWTGFIELWGLGKLMSLYSPSEKYDPIVKMVSSESGLNGYLTNPNTRATARLKEYEMEIRKMTQFKEKLRAIQDGDKASLLEECSDYGPNGYLKNPEARASARLKEYEMEIRKMSQFKEKLRAIQDGDNASLLEECSESGGPDQKKDHRADSEIPTYDLTEETESEEEGNESEQEQDQRKAEPSQGPTITPFITKPKDDILQQIAIARQELQETAKQRALLSAALERHRGNLQRMANTSSHREHDPTQSKVRDLAVQLNKKPKKTVPITNPE
ncbi:hypothetical protein AMECASPLE_039620 [Ameca splendens]|uniref:Uncharacterized protein n=1 Tax=Ameca splendens TaxID=208324 RepID=A0ABV0YWA1_9TELE